ncbi:MAG TPA: hypothetical protein VGO58_00605 [Chitinophagaceae bacterium]|jgi:hypothetical protein|nr:hypothetical protein [Chitinophagaceae bacterium]
MRLPPNLKYFLFFLLAIGLITLGTLYLPRIIPGIGKVVIAIVLIGMALLSFFVLFKPLFTFLYARADGIFTVYVDQSKQGFHVFAYHLNSGGEYSSFGSRDIQHYYILFETGKVYYKCIYSHSMQPTAGRSGWGGFISFEESVLTSPMFELSMKKLSARSKTTLQLGRRIDASGDDHFVAEADGKKAELKKFNTITDEGIRIACTDMSTGTILWEKKI